MLESIGVDIREIDAIFITHEHTDHISGAGILSRRFNIPIYANGETWIAMEDKIKNIDPINRREFYKESSFYFRDIFITPVPIFHDAANPNGFVLRSENEKISVVTDTGYINTQMLDMMRDSNLYFLESNHDIEMLKTGRYTWPLKQRILSTKGHLSNDNTSEVLQEIIKKEGEIYILSHLSIDNNTPEIAYNQARKTLENKGGELDIGSVKLEVAPRFETSKLYDLKEEK